MKTVYIAEPGGVVRREGELLRVATRGDRRGDIPVHDLAQLVLMGNITVTPAAFALLLDRGIDVVMLSTTGNFRGRVTSGASSNVRLRLAQYEHLRDPARALDLARRIVLGKIANQRALLLRKARSAGTSLELRRGDVAMRAAALRAEGARSLDEVRGCEGSAAAAYFRAFGTLIRTDGIAFDGRNRRPPMDPVNAMLSLGYTLLANAVEACVQVVGLDPYLGALHAAQAGRPSLVCDLMEEYRAPVVDGLVLAALHKEAIKAADFESGGHGEPVIFRRDALRWFITLFERKMTRPTHYAATGKSLPWRSVIEAQVRRLARELLGDTPYQCHEVR